MKGTYMWLKAKQTIFKSFFLNKILLLYEAGVNTCDFEADTFSVVEKASICEWSNREAALATLAHIRLGLISNVFPLVRF